MSDRVKAASYGLSTRKSVISATHVERLNPFLANRSLQYSIAFSFKSNPSQWYPALASDKPSSVPQAGSSSRCTLAFFLGGRNVLGEDCFQKMKLGGPIGSKIKS